MIKLDDDLLNQLGLGTLPPEEKKKLLAHIYETLEMRVGMKLAEQMSDEQLAEFEQFIDSNDEAGALRWLESNFPNYKDVVAAEFEQLKQEIGQVAPQIAAASAAQAQQAGVAPAGDQTMYQQPAPQQPYGAAPVQPQPMPGTYPQQPQPMPPQYQQPQAPVQPQQNPAQPGQQPQRDDYDLAG